MCVDGLGYVYVCESLVVLDQCDEPPPSLFVFYVCAYGGVVGYLRCFSFPCEFSFLYCDDVRLGAVYYVFSSSILFRMPFYVDLKYDDVFVLWLIVVCKWVGVGCL